VLILAATPIGNLGDASARLIEALKTSQHIAAEDTRSLLKLANVLGVKLAAKLYSLHEHNEGERIAELLAIAVEQDVLVVSDAGMPTVSDPGFLLVRAAVAAGVEVSILPGPSAVLAALAVSGLATDRFCFEGFLPRKDGERTSAFEALAAEARTMIFFDSPHRIHDSLKVAAKVFGFERRASISREITKKFEQTVRGTIAELVEWSAVEPKGELVLVIAGAEPSTKEPADLVDEVLAQCAVGIGLKQAVAEVAAVHRVKKSILYQLALDARAQK
jgi:16S rRNA (cytidine1402-2'-O)-methyltransferase